MKRRPRDRFLSRSILVRVLAGLAVFSLAVPGLAAAERKRERRTLPAGAQAADRTPVRQQAQDPAVESGVDALRSAFGPQADPALARRGDLSAAHIARSRGGYVQALAAPAGRSYGISRPGPSGDPEGLALAFLREHGVAFGLSRMGTRPATEAVLSARRVRTRDGRSTVRLRQSFSGLPVFGAEALVQLDVNGGVTFALVDVARDHARLFEPDFSVRPGVSAEQARVAARGALTPAQDLPDVAADTPELMIYEPSVIGSAGSTRLVWHVRLASPTGPVNEVVLVDAATREIAFHYSEIMDAKRREVYDSNNSTTLPGVLELSDVPADLVTSVADAQFAFDYFGDTYDFYFDNYGRDSFDDAGATMIARARYCEGACPWANAYWNGSEMRFGDGYAGADDVVAHELTHAVTSNESNLIYWGESGAINEALSDIFGELVDLGNGAGTDTEIVRWQMGEDLPIGAIRNMSDPTLFGDPDRRFSPYWYTGNDDNRGVHINSGVANKLASLLADGGTFNGETVQMLGESAVADLFYEVQVNLLVPGSNYSDLYAALRQAAVNLTWAPAFRESVERASRAVEIDVPGYVVTVFQDDFEGAFPGSWTVTDSGGAGAEWGVSTHRQAGGSASLYCAGAGASAPGAGGPYLPDMDTWVVYGPFSLEATHAAWAVFDLYLDLEYPYDDVFWGVSIDGSTFDGYAVSPSPYGFTTGNEGTPGWAPETFNFAEITEETIVGATQVWFAFNFASDEVLHYEGAYVDNLEIKRAPASGPFGSFDTPGEGATGLAGAIPVTGWALDDREVTKVDVYRDPFGAEPPGQVYVGTATFVPGARPDVDALFPGYPFSWEAGWGYQLLTNMLPAGGNGTYTLHARATDDDANEAALGSKTITCDNAGATLPFGTIDTPGQGETVSGTIINFGWVLTPQPGTVPTDGSTITVYVDGVPLGNPVYNQYRADIATLFPGYSNSNGAVGYYFIDTTLLSNGIHTIQWVATDDLGRAQGIGSRYFWVDN